MAKVAQEVLAYCGNCKMDLVAMVVAMKGDQIVRVDCKTCKKERAYKAPKGIDTPAPKKPKATKESNKAASIEEEWRKIMNAHKNSPEYAYSGKIKMNVGDRIKHPTFGNGVVMKHIYPNKAEILFEMDLKVLICGGQKDPLP